MVTACLNVDVQVKLIIRQFLGKEEKKEIG